MIVKQSEDVDKRSPAGDSESKAGAIAAGFGWMAGIRHGFAGTLMLILAAYGAVKAGMYYQARYAIDSMLAPLSRGFDISYADIDVSLFGPVSIHDIVVRRKNAHDSVSIRQVKLLAYERDEHIALPRRLSLELTGLRFNAAMLTTDADSLPQAFRQGGYARDYVGELKQASDLEALGYRELNADVGVDFSFDRHSGDMRLHWRDRVATLGNLELSFAVTGFDPTQRYSRNNRLKFESAQLAYTDDSYLIRLYAALASQAGLGEAAYRQELRKRLDTVLRTYEVTLDPASQQALYAFIERPRSIRITMRPYEPVPLEHLRFYKIGDLPRLLNLDIRSDQGSPD